MPSRAQKKREKKNNYMKWTAEAAIAATLIKPQPENVMTTNEGINMTQQKNRRHSLTMSDNIRLVKFIEAEYKNQNKSDSDFAKLATDTLGFCVLDPMVQKRRNALGIPATKEVIHEQIQKQKAERAAEAARKRMERLEKQERQQKLDLKPQVLSQLQQAPLIDRIRTLETQMLNLTVQVQALQNQTNNKFLTLPVYEMTPGFKGTSAGPTGS